MFWTIIGIFATVTLPLSPIFAATFLAPEGESASVRSEIAGDLYVASNTVIVAAPVRGDIFAAGDSVDISGSSDASIFAVGRSVTVSGSAKDDVRVAGSAVSLTSTIAHDVFAAGSTVFLGAESSIGGDAYITGSDITITGTILGTLRVAGERVTIAKTAVITGDVISYNNEPVVENGAIISGKITTIAPLFQEEKRGVRSFIGPLVTSAVSGALLALLILWTAPLLIKNMLSVATARPVYSALLGLITLLLFFPITIILAVTGIGFHVAGLMFTGALFSIMLGMGSSLILMGSFVMRLLDKKNVSGVITWQHAVVGAVVGTLISLLGWIGFLTLFIIFLIGLGATLKALQTAFRA